LVSTTFQYDGDARPAPEPASDKVVEKAANTRWIVNPVFDSVFVFGGALWLMFALQIYWFHWDASDPKAGGVMALWPILLSQYLWFLPVR
jgi:hypothetical protein